MKNIIIYLFVLLSFNIYAQCNDYNEFNCNNDNTCDWVEDIETGNCGNLWGDDCELNPECNWNCDFVDDYMGWCNYSCDGGPYEIDNSYCQEIVMPECNEEYEFQCINGSCIPINRVCNNINDCEDGSDEIDCEDCSELLEFNCSNDDSCEWVQNLEIENCYDILDCTGGCTWQDCESIEGCNWHFGTAYYDPSYCYGEHEVDNSYCEEIVMPECSEMNELECSSDNSCNWVDNIEIGSCSSLSASECSQYFDDGCSLGADCIQWGSWYSWICYEYGPSYCTGGNIDIGNSYCEEIQYQLGDLNQDSIINIQDVIIIINFILNGEFDLVADINLDSIVNVLDVIQLVNIILNN